MFHGYRIQHDNNEHGLDIEDLAALKENGGRLTEYEGDAEILNCSEIFALDVDGGGVTVSYFEWVQNAQNMNGARIG